MSGGSKVWWFVGVICAAWLMTVVVMGSLAANADVDTGGTVNLGGLDAIPVTGLAEGFAEGPAVVWDGKQAPAPNFDTLPYGQDRSFVLGELASAAVGELDGTVVYVGDRDGEPMLMWAEERPVRNPWDYVYRWAFGHAGRDRLNASFDCCHYGVSEDSEGRISISPEVGSAYPSDGRFELQWLTVPAGTSIVAYEIDGQPLAFQRPIAGVASLTFEYHGSFDVSFHAIDADGHTLERTHPRTINRPRPSEQPTGQS